MATIKISLSGKEYSLFAIEFNVCEDACRVTIEKTNDNIVFLLGLSNTHFLDMSICEEIILLYIPISSIYEILW